MQTRHILIYSVLLLASFVLVSAVQSAQQAPAEETPKKLFAVEIKTGPNWDTSKTPYEQAYFKEHSANLKRMRDAGHIVMGARYSDIGLIIISAESAENVREFMAQDPSMEAGTFKYEVHAMNVFYPGMVKP